MTIGIDALALYPGRLTVDALALSQRLGHDPDEIARRVMVQARSVYPPCEDAVTLAVNAAKALALSEAQLASIELLVVGTESAVDFGKPVASWVHRNLGLSHNCRSFDVQHACYSGTAAFKMAAAWVASCERPDARALVINADLTRPNLAHGIDFVGGGCGVAMLVGANPRVLALDMGATGYWTNDVSDVIRPTAREETGDNQLSLFAYLDALEGSFRHLRATTPAFAFEDLSWHIYHAPFPAMTKQAHQTILRELGAASRAEIEASFEAKVLPGLVFGRQIGSAYGASNFVSLLGLLSTRRLAPGDRLSLFSYGSGCQGEFYLARIGDGAQADTDALAAAIADRVTVDLDEYAELEAARHASLERRDYAENDEPSAGIYRAAYAGKGLLMLDKVDSYVRSYRWS